MWKLTLVAGLVYGLLQTIKKATENCTEVKTHFPWFQGPLSCGSPALLLAQAVTTGMISTNH